MKQVKAVIVKLPVAERLGKKLVEVLRSWRVKRKAQALRQSRRNPTANVRVLVTGDVGKLGSMVAEFLKADYDVTGFDMKASHSERLGNYKLLKKHMASCQFVVYAAAIPHPNLGTTEDYFQTNVIGSFNVMRAAEANKIKRFIFFSSIGYYGVNIKGKLKPAYFPIDEAHLIASMEGQAEGMPDVYDQSKVMAEELRAFYDTNRVFEAIPLRVAPANKKDDQYSADDDSWRGNPCFRPRAFCTNCDPGTVCQVVKAALEVPGEFWYESFNICDKYAPGCIDVKAFLAEEYPDVPVKCDLSDNPSLVTSAKAERMLDFKPSESLR